MLTTIAICAGCFIYFIIGLSLSYRQGQRRGYKEGYYVGRCEGFNQGIVYARKEIRIVGVGSDNSSEHKGAISQPEYYIY